jgi:tetratricopeptide (TPR) repeat protein
MAGDLGWDSPSRRYRSFDAVLHALSELASQRALVLVLDDLHAVDPASLLLLEFLLEQPLASTVVFGLMRDESPRSESPQARALASLRAGQRTELALSGLRRDDIRSFVKLRFGSDDEELAESLFDRTGGHPLYLTLLASLPTPPRSGPGALPVAVREAVSRRLSSLRPESMRVLRAAAVYGREFNALVLAGISEASPEQCLRSLAEAAVSRVVGAVASNTYRFEHDLIREVLYEAIDGDERARLHHRVGEALEALPEYQHASKAGVLAHHFVSAAHCGGATRAVDLSIQAGAYALRNFGYEEAIEHFTRAVSFLPLCAVADPATECALLLDLGTAQISAGLRQVGQDTLHVAAAKAREIGAVEELADIALGLAPGLFSIETGVYDGGLVGLLREALRQVGERDDRLRALLLSRLAVALYWSDTFDERVALCAEAESLAERTGTDEVRAAVTTARTFALLRAGNLEERRALSDQAVELCGRVSSHHDLLINRLLRVAMFLENADMVAATFEADAFRKLAEEVRQPQALWILEAHRACRLLLEGKLDALERLAGSCLEAAQRARDHNAILTFGFQLVLTRLEQGRGNEVLPIIRENAAQHPRIPGWRVLHANVLGREGKRDECAAEYESLKATSFLLPDDLNWMVSMAWLAETCHDLNDSGGARLLYERLAPFAARLVVVGYAGIACLGSTSRYLGLLSSTLGDAAAAETHYRRAVDVNRRLAASLPLAHALGDYGALLASFPERATEGAAMRHEAASLASELGLAAVLRRQELR